MARVHLSGELRRLGDGHEVVEIEARTVAELVDRLVERFPAMDPHVREGVGIAIDGEVMPNAEYEAVSPQSVVHFVPPIAGG